MQCATEQTGNHSRRWILFTLCLGVVLVQTDTSLVNLAAHLIGEQLQVSLSVLQWTVDGYNLSYAILLMTGGTLADLFGRRRIFQTGIGLFIGGSILCALAHGAIMLIAGRIMSGVGAALLVPASLALLRVVWTEPGERAHAIGIFAAMNGLAFALGPPLGGLLASYAGWRSIFWIALPTGVAVLLLSATKMPESRSREARSLDIPGQLLMTLPLAAFCVAIIERGGSVMACTLFGAMGLLAFLWHERRVGAAAMMPLELFRNRGLVTAILVSAAMTFGMYGVIFLTPMVWLETGFIDIRQAGLLLLPMALSFALLSRWSGTWTRRFGARAMTTTGMTLISLGLFTLAMTTAGQPLWLAEFSLLATGVGMALNTGPILNVGVSAVEASRAGTASALVNCGRMIGATAGVAALGAILAVNEDVASGLTRAMTFGGVIVALGALLAYVFLRSIPRNYDLAGKTTPAEHRLLVRFKS